jgi:hypothetical protein
LNRRLDVESELQAARFMKTRYLRPAVAALFLLAVISYAVWIWMTYPNKNAWGQIAEAKALLKQRNDASTVTVARLHPDNAVIQFYAQYERIESDLRSNFQKLVEEIEPGGTNDFPELQIMTRAQLEAYAIAMSTAEKNARMTAGYLLPTLISDARQRLEYEVRKIDAGYAGSFLTGFDRGARKTMDVGGRFLRSRADLYKAMHELATFLTSRYGTYRYENGMWKFQTNNDVVLFNSLADASRATSEEADKLQDEVRTVSSTYLAEYERLMHGQ